MYVLLFNVSKKSVVMQLLVCIGLKEFVAIYTMRDTVNAVEIGGIELIVCIFFIVTNLRF